MAAKPTLKGTNRIITVDVTQPLIDRSEKADSGHCMIADAIRAAIPEAKSVAVDVVTIRFTDPAKRQRYIYLTPRVAQLALIGFDQGVPTEPFKFQLKKAMQVVESGRTHQPDGTKKNPSRAVQKVVGASGRNHPVKLGGDLPAVGALSSKPSQRKAVAAAAAKATTTKVTAKKSTAAEKRAVALKRAEEQVAGRDRGESVAKLDSNITLAETATRIRKFGMRQLRP